jgi:hypothetical protein
MLSITYFLKGKGWMPYEAGFIDSWGDRYVDLSGDSGYVWELKHFDDSDRDGVATPRWVTEAEGDTLAALQDALGVAK